MRVPLWADKREVRGTVSGRERPNRWHGRYLQFDDLTPQDTVTITFPVVETTQHWTIPSLNWPGPKEQEHACRFRGNTLVELSPDLMEGSPLYRSRPMRFAGSTTPMKKTTRYATDKVLRW